MENTKPEETILPVFRKVGQILAEARKEQGLTIKQVADIIHIRRKYLLDMEEGRLSELPGRVYMLGFIRTYARLLKLDGEELIRQMEGVPNFPTFESSQASLPFSPEEGPSSRLLIISVILTLLTAAGGYIFFKPSKNETSLIIQKDTPLPPPLEDSPNGLIRQNEKAGIEENATLKAPTQNNEASAGLLKDIGSAPALDSQVLSDPLKKDVVLKAKEPSWLEIRDNKGEVLFMKVLQRGETYTVPNQPGIIINIGNAGGIDAFYGDLKLPSLGERGKVKRGILLESLKK